MEHKPFIVTLRRQRSNRFGVLRKLLGVKLDTDLMVLLKLDSLSLNIEISLPSQVSERKGISEFCRYLSGLVIILCLLNFITLRI